MTPERLDYLFPFCLFGYGFLMIIANQIPAFDRLSDYIRTRQTLAFLCLIVGGLWSLQNLLLTP